MAPNFLNALKGRSESEPWSAKGLGSCNSELRCLETQAGRFLVSSVYYKGSIRVVLELYRDMEKKMESII